MSKLPTWRRVSKLRIATFALAALCAACPRSAASSWDGKKAVAALELEQVGGPRIARKDMGNKVLLINFLSTWCFPCLSVIDGLKRLQAEYGGENFSVIAVGMDLEGPLVLAPFAEHYRLTFPLLCADDAMRQGQTPFGKVVSLPTTFLIGKDGKLKAAFEGLTSQAELEKLVKSSLSL